MRRHQLLHYALNDKQWVFFQLMQFFFLLAFYKRHFNKQSFHVTHSNSLIHRVDFSLSYQGEVRFAFVALVCANLYFC